jgi:azurin
MLNKYSSCISFAETFGCINKTKLYRKVFRSFLLFLLVSSVVVRSNAQKPFGVNSIVIETVNGLQYDLVRFKVKPGEKVKITLKNVSDMSHNLLIVKPGTRLKVINAALELAEKGPQMDYIPKVSDVLWSVPLISPGQNKSVTFTAPSKAGVYPYVCTFPGHGFVMYGAMYVMQEGAMPDIAKDKNIPESRRQEDKKNKNDKVSKVIKENKDQEKKDMHADMHADHQVEAGPHPYALTPPYLYHAFIDGVSPAAIAVRLPQELSYCWDDEACRLSFAWKGDFLDMSDLWKGHFNASAKVLGDVFFRDQTEFPIRLGENATVPAAVKYKGYRLVNEYPEFHYTLDGMEVYELIREKPDGNGLIRSFRIPHAEQTVWLFTNREEDAIEYESSAGKWEYGKLELSPTEAKEFTITMTSYYLAYKKKKK